MSSLGYQKWMAEEKRISAFQQEIAVAALYISSISEKAGKTLLAVGLAKTWQESGKKVGYLKLLTSRSPAQIDADPPWKNLSSRSGQSSIPWTWKARSRQPIPGFRQARTW
jgi:AAA domain